MTHIPMTKPILSAKTKRILAVVIAIPALLWVGMMLEATGAFEPDLVDCCANGIEQP